MSKLSKSVVKRVFITGAGSGLGKALALEFARRQWEIGIADVNHERLTVTARQIRAVGKAPLMIPCNVSKAGDLQTAATAIMREWKGLDVLINNAGIAAAGLMEKIPAESWKKIIDINTMGIINGCRAFIPIFKEQGTGSIVNIASYMGFASFPEMGCYNMTKAAAISLSETLRIELSPYNIRVSVACPSFFKTNLMESFFSPEQRQEMLASRFFEKSGTTAEEVARHIVKCIIKKRFYIITQMDARFIWFAKRFMPETYFRVASFVYRKGLFEKYLMS